MTVEMDIVGHMPGIIGISIGFMAYSIYNIWRKKTGYYEHGGRTKAEKVRNTVVMYTIVVLLALSAVVLWDGVLKEHEMLAILFPALLVIGALISSIYDFRLKKIGEPEHDERTEKVTGKAAKATIIVLLGAFAVILWGDFLGLFKLETRETLAILFPVLMLSMLGFVTYYNSKEF